MRLVCTPEQLGVKVVEKSGKKASKESASDVHEGVVREHVPGVRRVLPDLEDSGADGESWVKAGGCERVDLD